MNSALYEGSIVHQRTGDAAHAFRYPIAMPMVDLAELPDLFDRFPFWSARRPAPARFRREDYLPGARASLTQEARDLVERQLGRRPEGAVSLLANPRYLGVGFNPVSFLFLRGEADDAVEAVIAEVTSTPWGERTAYVIDGRDRSLSGIIEADLAKVMHVSPFQPMRRRYRVSLSDPGERLRVAIESYAATGGDRPAFAATLALERRPLTRRALAGMVLARPPATALTLARIYAHAVRLRLKGAAYHPRPRPGIT